MTGRIPRRWNRVAGHFAAVLRQLVDHRGIDAEVELIDVIGLERLKALYEGEEPRLGEFVEAARILRVPLSTFQINEPGAHPELEIAFAEILYAASEMSSEERARLAEAMVALPRKASAPKHGSSEGAVELPDSILSALRRTSE